MDFQSRQEALKALRDEVKGFVAAERKRLNDERDFLLAIKGRTTNKISNPHTKKVVQSAQQNVRALVGLDTSFDDRRILLNSLITGT